VCSYCSQIDEIAEKFGTGTKKGTDELGRLIEKIKSDGKKEKYDCVIGVSGGIDSSYLLLKAVEWGLRPLAVHYDNTWNSAIATMNIEKVTRAMSVDLYTYIVDNYEIDDIKASIVRARILEFDADTDVAIIQVLRSVAAKYHISYILEGHSFITEGISPVSQNYFDGRFIKDIHEKYGHLKMKTFPNLTFFRFMRWTLLHQQQIIRPLWYIKYDKDDARNELAKKTGWQYYGGHHLENRASTFFHTVWAPQGFNIDFRNLTIAAEVRSGKITRKEGLRRMKEPIKVDPSLTEFVLKRLKMSKEELDLALNGEKQNWRNFKSYKRRFELFRPIFLYLLKRNRVTHSFYIKYCFPI
jgi:tRNA(Ile)-lysidine synthase TilS/MesJ